MNASPAALAKLSPREQVRLRLYTDFRFYAEHGPLVIQTKDGQSLALRLNPAQQQFADLVEHELKTKGRARIIVLKGRQMGLSTGVCAYLYWKVSQNRNRKAFVVTNTGDTTAALFSMTHHFHNNVAEGLRSSTSFKSRSQLYFDKLESGYKIATAGANAVGRGQTFFYVHLSEFAFWPTSSAEENFNALMQAVPAADDTAVIIESTANGVANLFYREWQKAVRGESDFAPLFCPWFIDPGYVRPVTAPLVLDDYERKLREDFPEITDEQLMFRRAKIAETDPDKFRQEYPAYPDEAFLTTGAPVFPPAQLAAMREQVREPRAHYSGDAFWNPAGSGPIAVWEEPRAGEQYFVSADVASGSTSKGKDWSVGHVLSGDGRVVARYRDQVLPHLFAIHLSELARRYNGAQIIVEANNHGGTVLNVLDRQLGYTNLYRDITHNQVDEDETLNLGFNTNKRSKPMVINKLRNAIREGSLNIPDKVTLDELSTFVEKPDGGMSAEGKNHDDCVMSLALAYWIHERRWEPIKNQESWYFEAL